MLSEYNNRCIILNKSVNIIHDLDSVIIKTENIQNRGAAGERVMDERRAKNHRILELYERLRSGKVVQRDAVANEFGVTGRSIERDIKDIRIFLEERRVEGNGEERTIVYDADKSGYRIIGNEQAKLSNGEILAVSKILLESRAFIKAEIDKILKILVDDCVPEKDMKLVAELIANEKFHYVELKNKTSVHDRIWEIGNDIKERNLIQIEYQRLQDGMDKVSRIVEPVSIMFSEYYFYLIAFIVAKDEKGRYIHLYDYPAIFRVDRITDYIQLGEKYRIEYSSRFEEGEFRKKIQFMYAGELMKSRLKYRGENPEAVLDRLPTARVIAQEEDGWLIEAETYGKGLIMWLLSQGDRVEVIAPEKLREEVRGLVENLHRIYKT